MKRNVRIQPFVTAFAVTAFAMCFAMWLTVASATNAGTVVRFATAVGDFDVELFDATAPNIVANFLNYVNDGDYVDSIGNLVSVRAAVA